MTEDGDWVTRNWVVRTTNLITISDAINYHRSVFWHIYIRTYLHIHI